MKIFSYKERQAIFKATEDNGANINELVGRVGDGVANEIASRWKSNTHVIVFAGWGLNGAYALATAKSLIEQGFNPEIYLFNIGGRRITPECYYAKRLLLKNHPKANIIEIVQQFETPDILPDDVVVDGLFGADLDRPLPRTFGMLIRSINESDAQIVSIEIPSGLFCDWNTNNALSRDIIHAYLTVAIEFPCLSFFMKENIDIVGEWCIVNIGLDREAIRQTPHSFYLVTRQDARMVLKPRSASVSKADLGSALVCAGSYGMMGAAVLATLGCMRAGVGKATCYSPRCGFSVMQTCVPSALFLKDSNENCLSNIAPEHTYTGIAIGPGIGTSEITINAVENFLKTMSSKRMPLVIDADALNCIALRPNLINYVPQLSVLTPHEGEFDRIFGSHPSAELRIQRALEVAQYHNIIIAIKGHYTAVVRPDGKVHINSSGTSALATAGSGDVLAGVITSLIAQGYSPEIAAIIASYIHGKAGRIAESEHGNYGVLASDVAANIGKAIKAIMD